MAANRNWIIVAVAALLGIVAVIMANSYLSGVEKSQATAAEENRLVQIAVARVPMAYGTALTSENIRMVSWPATSVPAGHSNPPKRFSGLKRVLRCARLRRVNPFFPEKSQAPVAAPAYRR